MCSAFAIAEARHLRIGIDGIALTELQHLVGLRDIEAADEVEHRTRLEADMRM